MQERILYNPKTRKLYYNGIMISVEEALDKILSRIQPLGFEKVPLMESLGRVTGENIDARRDIPPMDNSGMDGYAVKTMDIEKASKDRPVRLEVIEDLPAGFISQKTLREGQAIRIMTGAPIPKGADTVVPVEETQGAGSHVLIFKAIPSGEYIRKAGGDVRQGDRVLSKGETLRPAEIGMLAATGRSSVLVYQKPLVAILCTGEELVDIDEPLEGIKIVSSNSYTLAAQVKEVGAIPVQLGIAKDRKEDVEQKLRQGLRADVLVSSAGISVGDYDFVKEALKGLGMEMVFWKVAMKPGKPMAFGTIQGKPVFGLPGNPVSSMVSFEQFVRPSLLKMMGHCQLFRPVIEATLQADISKKAGRRHYLRAVVSSRDNQYVVTTTGAQGSDILNSMARANGLIVISEDRELIRAGERVKVQLLDPSFL
jgi:molybdopterin molybdotransferase